jgi:hypothetical protein
MKMKKKEKHEFIDVVVSLIRDCIELFNYCIWVSSILSRKPNRHTPIILAGEYRQLLLPLAGFGAVMQERPWTFVSAGSLGLV